ncbi:uncharacterized protein LOC62_03G003806 [Vanrija pseudolonga]|uniref:Uncharacterized protein n=1 Tax=Vanrija pseudolonga TaxID=143232 RepID=A0AAF1BHI1_9TREE|nr:hypothetical protein LOC62_03G003806 [Vanrija pseudolonga]
MNGPHNAPVSTVRPGLDCALDFYIENRIPGGHFPMVLRLDWSMDPAPTLRERVMLRFMDSVTDLTGWEQAVFDAKQIDSYWEDRYELAADSNVKPSPAEEPTPEFDMSTDLGHVGFSEKMFEWCIWELQAKAQEYLSTGSVSVYDMDVAIFKKDVPGLHSPLEEEALQTQAMHWQPGHNDTNLKVVQPALYALEYNRTKVFRPCVVTRGNCLDLIGEGEVVARPQVKDQWYKSWAIELSTRFQLLPSEVQLDNHGKAHITGYINNMHPFKHASAYRAIERILDEALPLLKAAYNSVRSPPQPEGTRFPWYLQRCQNRGFCMEVGEKNEWGPPINQGCKPENYRYVDGAPSSPTTEEMDEWFTRTHPSVLPEPFDTSAAQDAFNSVHRYNTPRSWAEPGGQFQVIVSVGNILLSPEKPTYDSGSFHVEGLLNERICASALYYYDSDNITDSRLAFEAKAHPYSPWLIPDSVYEPYSIDREWSKELFGVTLGATACSKHVYIKLGAVQTPPGRLVVFPNVLGHRVEPFELVDKTRAGHRKVVAIFLVDPKTPIISTADVPPQQRLWAEGRSHLLGATVPGLEVAHEIAEELIKERSNLTTGQIGYGTVD